MGVCLTRDPGGSLHHGGLPVTTPRPLLVPGVTVKVEEPKYKKDKQLNEKISLFRGDITKLEVDAIVNAGEWGLWAGPESETPAATSSLCQAHSDATWLQ